MADFSYQLQPFCKEESASKPWCIIDIHILPVRVQYAEKKLQKCILSAGEPQKKIMKKISSFFTFPKWEFGELWFVNHFLRLYVTFEGRKGSVKKNIPNLMHKVELST